METAEARSTTGRFTHGNRFGARHRGGERPPGLLKRLPIAAAEQVWDELFAVAFDAQHPWHDEHGFAALKLLVNKIFPTPTAHEVTGGQGGPAPMTNWVDPVRATRGTAPVAATGSAPTIVDRS